MADGLSAALAQAKARINKTNSKTVTLAKQAVQGLALPFVMNRVNESPYGGTNYLPTGIEMLPALAGTVAHLAGVKGRIPYLDDAAERVTGANDRLNAKLGITNPTDASETAFNILGSLVLPVPKGAAVVKAATKPVSTAAKVAQGVGKVVTEVALPLRQGSKYLPTAAAVVPAGVALSEGIDAVADNPEYTSVAEALSGDHVPIKVKDPMDRLDAEQRLEFETAVANDDVATVEAYSTLLDELGQDDPAISLVPEEPTWKNPVITAAALAAAGLGGYAGMRVLSDMADARLAKAAGLPGTPDLVGQRTAEQANHIGTKLTQGMIQGDQAIREGYKVASPNKEAFETAAARLDGATSGSINAKVNHAMSTGNLPNSSVTIKPLGPVLESYAKLTDGERSVIREGLAARTALDDIKKNGLKPPSPEVSALLKRASDIADAQMQGKPYTDLTPDEYAKINAASKDRVQASFNDLTPAQLEMKAKLLENDPKLAKYGDAIKEPYRGILDFYEDTGMITPQMAAEARANNSNYVHLGRNRVVDDNTGGMLRSPQSNSANNRLSELFHRSDEEFGGVQAGEAIDPIVSLPRQLDRAIAAAEANRSNREALETFSNNVEMGKWVKRIPDGEAPKSMEGIVEVYDKGKKVFYKVTDPTLYEAFQTPGMARGPILQGIAAFNKSFMQNTTGLAAPLFAVKSSTYDVITGMMLRPKGTQFGILNEAVNSIRKATGKNSIIDGALDIAQGPLSYVDPTSWLSSPIGALRTGFDELPRVMANTVAESILQEGAIYRALGPQNADKLRDALASAFDRTIKSKMEASGAVNSSVLNVSDPAGLAHGLADIAPKFTRKTSEDIYKAAMEGGANPVTSFLKGSSNLFTKARANSIANLYVSTIRAVNEGARYQYFATNLPKVYDDDTMAKLASQTRRIASDPTQRGRSQLANELYGMAVYANVGVQDLAQTARMVKAQPVTTAMNILATVSMLAALHYSWAAANPEEAIADAEGKSDDQKVRSVTTHGGLEIPLPPTMQMFWAPIQTVMDEITGLNSGAFNPEYADAIESWLDDGAPMTEAGLSSLKEMSMAALTSTSPVTLGSNPVVNAGANMLGVNLGLSRFGQQEMAPIYEQGLGPLGGQGALADDALSARFTAAMGSLFGTTVAGVLRTAMDADRALTGEKLDGTKGSVDDAVTVAFSRMKDNNVRSAKPVANLIFGDYESVKSVNTTEYRLFVKKKEGIQKAIDTLNQTMINNEETSQDPRHKELRDIDFVRPDFMNTALNPIGRTAKRLVSRTRKMQLELNTLTQQAVKNIPSQKFSTIEERNAKINEVNEQRKEIAAQMLMATRMAEQQIANEIGDPSFTFQNFDPARYAELPWPPVPVEPAPAP